MSSGLGLRSHPRPFVPDSEGSHQIRKFRAFVVIILDMGLAKVPSLVVRKA